MEVVAAQRTTSLERTMGEFCFAVLRFKIPGLSTKEVQPGKATMADCCVKDSQGRHG